GYSHTLAIKTNGSLWCGGNNSYGQVGDNTNEQKNSPTQIGSGTDWKNGSAGYWHTVATKDDGTLWAWGLNYSGQLGLGVHGSGTDQWIPTQVGTDKDWSMAAAGFGHTVAIKNNGTLWSWGLNDMGQLGLGAENMENTNVPVQIGQDTDWIFVAAEEKYSLALKADGTLWSWGVNEKGQLAIGTTANSCSPVQVGTRTDWVKVVAGYSHAAGLVEGNGLFVWGNNYSGNLGTGNGWKHLVPGPVNTDTDWAVLGSVPGNSSATHALAIKTDGTLWAWGNNASGQLGNGTTNAENTPVQVGGDDDWQSVTGGYAHTVAIRKDGTLWAWGRNYDGELGIGTSGSGTDEYAPIQVGSDTDWLVVSAGFGHTLALKKNGTLWGWGKNTNYQLGDGTTVTSTVPKQIGSDTDWQTVSAGGEFGLAIKKNGDQQTLWTWGDNLYSQLGDGTQVDQHVPTQLGIDTDWERISGGSYYSLASKKDSTSYGWGNNGYRQIKYTSTNPYKTPVALDEPSGWYSLAPGNSHSLGIKNNGELWAWGNGGDGQIGNDSVYPYIYLYHVQPGTTWSAITAGSMHTLAIRSDNTLWGWGQNASGQLGDGSAWSTVPIELCPAVVLPETSEFPWVLYIPVLTGALQGKSSH
ncbi:MAG: hypothetical protein AB7U63_17750, partial [Porticoccaceae bacterium]